MKAIYNNSQNSLIAFKGDHEPIQFYKGGQLIENLSAGPLSIEGNPAQYKSEYKKNLLSLGLEGNTFQQTGGIPSPNPQYPQTIQNAENLSVALKGINMVRFPYHFDSRTINGITFTINEDRSISAKGTATAAAAFTVMYLTTALPLPKGRYFIGGIVGGSSSTYRLRFSSAQKAITDAYNDSFFTVAEDTTYRYLYFTVTAGATVDTTVKPILAKVNEDIPVSYEPYIEPQTVNIPKSATFNEGTKEILLAKLGDVYDDLTIDRLTNKVVYNKRINRVVFDGTEATCTVFITGDRSTDYISATMTLKQGTRVIDEWEDSGYGVLAMEGIAEVTRRKTYTLRVDATVNGVEQPTVTIARTND
jgi:hypothetical protein